MSTGIQACDIVLPGYVLSERIGSGGYAEVWRAEAPGGIEKAVKIVYGYYNDEFAAQELKSLERIKGVRHPFLLSLERFEVVNGRLAILTELADMSLDQRLSQCQAEGLPGIPRGELLRYMSDAAEALDFLSQRHNLLHLDIKPENLLISGRSHQGGRLRTCEGTRHANPEFARFRDDAHVRGARDFRRRTVGPKRSVQSGDRLSANAGGHLALSRSHGRPTRQATHAVRAAIDFAAGR